MIRAIHNYFAAITAVVIDGWIYVLMAVFTNLVAVVTSDEAAKYVSPFVIFILKSVFTTTSNALLAIKMYRSTAFADHRQEQKRKSGETTFITKP